MCVKAMCVRAAAAASWVMLAAAPAWAQHGAEAAQEHVQPDLFGGDLGNVIWTGIIFLVLLTVLGKYAWGPMLAALNRREQFIRETIETARKDRADAERLLQRYREQLAGSQAEAATIIEQGRRDAEAARQHLHDQARTEAEAIIQRARQEIAAGKQAALQELRDLAADLSVDVAAKILKRRVEVEDQHRLIEESLAQLASRGGGQG